MNQISKWLSKWRRGRLDEGRVGQLAVVHRRLLYCRVDSRFVLQRKAADGGLAGSSSGSSRRRLICGGRVAAIREDDRFFMLTAGGGREKAVTKYRQLTKEEALHKLPDFTVQWVFG